MRLQDYGERRGIFAVCLAVVALIARCSSSPDYSGCEGLESIGDGCCDMDNNNAECGYDGGDCCPCTCVEAEPCEGYVGFDCRDPDVECGRDPAGGGASESDYPACAGNITLIGDGFCDDGENNNPLCGYDGGDCCSCKCELRDSVEYSCTSVFVCRDPYADCGSSLSSAEASYLGRGCLVQSIGDGVCDLANNSEDCLFDGGDCCSCTCNDGIAGSCGVYPSEFACVNPDAECDSSSAWPPVVGASLGLVALGIGCRAIYRYGVRRRAAVGGPGAGQGQTAAMPPPAGVVDAPNHLSAAVAAREVHVAQ